MTFRYTVVEDGREIGVFTTAERSWRIGDELSLAAGVRRRIRALLPASPNELDRHGVMEVELMEVEPTDRT